MSFLFGQDAPSAPDYSPVLQGDLIGAQHSLAASDNLENLAADRIGASDTWARAAAARASQSAEYGDNYARAASDRANQYADVGNQVRDYGLNQLNNVWPYASNYLSRQDALSNLAGENASDSVIAARQQRQQANDTYGRYMSTFAPLETQYAQTAADYNSPARAAQASAAARGDVATTFDAQEAARQAEQRSYGIDPSQARYQGADLTSGLQRASALASAGTQARRASEQTGLALQRSAIGIGQNLPQISTALSNAATTGAAYGLRSGEYGGSGITAGTGLITAGVNALGSPTNYAQLASAPYTTLAGQYNSLSAPYATLSGNAGSVGASLAGSGASALGNITNAATSAGNTLNQGYQNRANTIAANNAAINSTFGGIGQALGGIANIGTGGGSTVGGDLFNSATGGSFLGSSALADAGISSLSNDAFLAAALI